MLKWLGYGLLAVVVIFGVLLMLGYREKNEIKKEVAEMRDAVLIARTYHGHYQGPLDWMQGEVDGEFWVKCPSSRYEIMRRRQDGTTFERVQVGGKLYDRARSPWSLLPDPEGEIVSGCTPASGNNALELPSGFDEMIEKSEIEVAKKERQVEGEPCWDYTFRRKGDAIHPEGFEQTICIDSTSHLPRMATFRTRKFNSFETEEAVYTYDHWNESINENFPEGFVPD